MAHRPTKNSINGFEEEDETGNRRALKRPLLDVDNYQSEVNTNPTDQRKHEQNNLIGTYVSNAPQVMFGESTFVRNEQIKKQSCWSTTKLFARHSFRDLKRHKCHYCLAFCSIFIVVLSSILVASLVDKGPIIFLKMSQDSHGEVDVYVTPNQQTSIWPYSQNRFLNFTTVDRITNHEYRISPRKVFIGQQFGIYRSNNKQRKYLDEEFDDVDHFNHQETIAQSFLMIQEDQGFPTPYELYYNTPNPNGYSLTEVINTEREREAQMGVNYTLPPLEYGQCNINQDYHRSLGANVGDIMYFQFYADDLLNNIIKIYNAYAQTLGHTLVQPVQSLRLRMPCMVSNVMEGTNGKFGDYDTSRQVVMEYDHYLPLMIDYLPEPLNLNSNFTDFIKDPQNINLESFADHIVMNLPSPRYQWYLSDNFDVIQDRITKYANDFVNKVGFYPIMTQFFIMEEMEKYSMGILFVHLVFDIVIVIFIIISILLIYSLLMIGVETKTMESGIMRMVGLSKRSFIGMIIIQSIMFALPAIGVAFVLSFPILAIAYKGIFDEDLTQGFAPVPSFFAVLQGIFVGLFIPLISSLFPIFRVLGQNLNDSLNYDRSRVKSIYIEILKKSRANIVPILLFGLMAVAYGIAIYYMLPLSLLSFNFGLILRIFFFILLGMLLGLCLMAINVQRILEIVFCYAFLFWEKKASRIMVMNNLMAHKMRNRLTSIIYSLALGFIIFLIVAAKLQLDYIRMNSQRRYGTYPMLDALYQGALLPADIDPVLQRYDHLIENHAWISWDLQRISPKIYSIMASDAAKLNYFQIGFYGLTPKVYDTVGYRFVDAYYTNEDSGLSMSEQLFTARGSQGTGTSTMVVQKTNSDPTNEKDNPYFLMRMDASVKPNLAYKMRPIFALSQTPLFTMLDKKIAGYGDKITAVVSMPMYARYSNLTMEEMSYERLLIKMQPWATDDQLNSMLTDMRASMSYRSNSVIFRTSNDNTIDLVDSILEIIFDTIIAITMFLCFFSLSSSMTANLYEQTKEIGVMRSIGFTQARVIMIYLYEAFILVMASSCLGVIIGILVGWTMATQQAMFQNLPSSFFFPFWEVLMIFLISILCAIISTYGPTKQIMSRRIASILKMT